MLSIKGPVVVDMIVDKSENVFPMVPSGAAHNEMLLGDETEGSGPKVTSDGLSLV